MKIKINTGIFYKKKMGTIPVDILLFFMWLVDAFYVQTSTSHYSDYIEYYNVYNGIKDNYFEWGYYYVGVFAKSIGLSFFSFRMIFVTITLLLMRNSILRYAKEPIWVTFIYMIHPFLLQCIQIRNAFSIALIIFSLRYLDEDNKNVIKFAICIVIAFMFHSSAILYVILLSIIYIKPKKIIKMSLSLLLFLEIVLYMFKSQIVIIMSSLLNISKIAYYLTEGDNRIMTKSMFVYLILYFIFLIVYKKFYNTDNFDGVLLLASILVLTYIPLMLVNYDYYRIYEYFFPVMTIALFNVLHGKGTNRTILKIMVKLLFLAITLYQSYTWIVDNNNEVLSNIILFK